MNTKDLQNMLFYRVYAVPRGGFKLKRSGKHKLGRLSAKRNDDRRKKIVRYYKAKGIQPMMGLSGFPRRRLLDEDFTTSAPAVIID